MHTGMIKWVAIIVTHQEFFVTNNLAPVDEVVTMSFGVILKYFREFLKMSPPVAYLMLLNIPNCSIVLLSRRGGEDEIKASDEWTLCIVERLKTELASDCSKDANANWRSQL